MPFGKFKLITNRRVYFISGFDPRGAGFYHRLYREESINQSRLNGAELFTEKRQRNSELFNSWKINSQWGLSSTSTDYQFLCWDDIIRSYWAPSLWPLIVKSAGMYLWHVRSGLLRKFKSAGRGPFISSVLPLVFILSSLLIASSFAMLTGYLLQSMFDNILISLVSAVAVFVGLGILAKVVGEKWNVWWILQTYLFLSIWGRKGVLSIESRLEHFAEKIIADDQESAVDEILLIGHCVGSILSVNVLAKILGQEHEHLIGKLKLITLGQCIPYVSYQSTATKFREALTLVAKNERFPWLDMGARADPLCFDEVNPAVFDGEDFAKLLWPTKFLVRPYQMYNADAYKKLKKNKMRIHFQYLMSSELLNEYDYFRMTTGPQSTEINSNKT